jgi:hypothetical protein
MVRNIVLAVAFLAACGDPPSEPPYEPIPARLVGEFMGHAGDGFEAYQLFLAVDEVADSVRGLWSLAFQASCATHDGLFSGILNGDQLLLRLQPDEVYEATLDVSLRVFPGDSVLSGQVTLVKRGDIPGYDGPALCGSDQLAPITLHFGEIDGLPRAYAR